MPFDQSPFTAKIAQIEVEKASLIQQLEDISKNFVEATERFMVDWHKQAMDETVKRHPETIKKLDSEGKLSAFKAEFNQLCERFGPIVEAKFSDDKYWGHRSEIPEDKPNSRTLSYRYTPRNPNILPDEFETAVRELTKPLAELAVKYGLEGSDWKTFAGQAQYAYQITCSRDMIGLGQHYDRMFKKLCEVVAALKKSKKDLEETIAHDLWNSA